MNLVLTLLALFLLFLPSQSAPNNFPHLARRDSDGNLWLLNEEGPSVLPRRRRDSSNMLSGNDCSAIPLSFPSTELSLRASKNRTPVGTVSVALTGGELSVSYLLSPGCSFTDDIHVNLVSTDSPLGTTSNVAPGRFPCKAPAAGNTESITCPLSAFPLSDCCASALRLLIHAVVNCEGASSETAYAGTGTCSTRQWCNFADVEVDDNCPTCNECSSVDNACIPVSNGLTPQDCMGAICLSPSTPGNQSCQNGACSATPDLDCEACNTCTGAGACTPVKDGELTGVCEGKACNVDGIPVLNTCASGECIQDPMTSCGDCELCSGGVCVADTSPECTCTTTCDETTGEILDTKLCQCVCPPCFSSRQGVCQLDSGCECLDACVVDPMTGEGTCSGECPSCEMESDCGEFSDCIDGTCVESSICTAKKESLCDDVFAALSGKSNNAAKCCPSTSGCVKNQLGLGQNSVCSTTCGDCDPTVDAASGGNGVKEVFCKFGDFTSTTTSLVICQEVVV